MTKTKNNRQSARRWALFFYTLYVSVIPLNMIFIPFMLEKFPLPTLSLLALTPSSIHLGRPGKMHHVDIAGSMIGLIVFLLVLQALIAWLHFKNSERLLGREKPRLLPYSLSITHYLITFSVTIGEPSFNDTIKSIVFFGTLIALVLVLRGLIVTKKVIDCNQSNKDSTKENT